MIISTKKYQFSTQTYIRFAFTSVMKEFWWAWAVPVVILLIPVFYRPALWWCVSIALLLSILYVLFWLIQFVGVTQMEQSKFLFQKLSYDISSKHLLIKLNQREGMPLAWNNIKKIQKGKDYFLLIISRGQMIHLPFHIFKTENELKFVETILKRKNLL